MIARVRTQAWTVGGLLLTLTLGCAGLMSGGGQRLSNAELVVVSFGSVNGETSECG